MKYSDPNSSKSVKMQPQLTIFLVAVLVRVCVAVLVAVHLGEGGDLCRSFNFGWRLVYKLLQLFLIYFASGG